MEWSWGFSSGKIGKQEEKRQEGSSWINLVGFLRAKGGCLLHGHSN